LIWIFLKKSAGLLLFAVTGSIVIVQIIIYRAVLLSLKRPFSLKSSDNGWSNIISSEFSLATVNANILIWSLSGKVSVADEKHLEILTSSLSALLVGIGEWFKISLNQGIPVVGGNFPY
jgi:hypothetical protein